MATINNIKKRAKEITNAYEPESVTAEKVGQLFEDIADITEQAAEAAKEASGYLADLQEAIQDLPDGQAVTAEVAEHTVAIGRIDRGLQKVGSEVLTDADADFDLADDEGNVAVRLSGGHIKTKNFDSSQIQHTVTTEEGQTRLVVGSAFVESGVLYL